MRLSFKNKKSRINPIEDSGKRTKKMEPAVGIEPTTC